MKLVLRYFFLVLSAYCLLACADSLSADKSVEKDMVLYLSAAPVNHLVPDSKSVEEIYMRDWMRHMSYRTSGYSNITPKEH